MPSQPLWLATTAVLGFLLVLPGAPVALGQETPDAAEGRELYVDSCASCHGAEGRGTDHGPSLVGVGAASTDFYLRTGRMPLATGRQQAVKKDPVFDDPQIESLVAYVSSLGDGPPIPEVELADAELAAGQELFRDNCAACHGAAGAGGAVGENAFAPSLLESHAVQVAEATIIGPGQMPKFAFDEEELNDLVGYVDYLQGAPDPGGEDIGRTGPVAEGFVAWVVGMGALVAVAVYVGRRREPAPGQPEEV